MLSTTPATICGSKSATISATADPGVTLSWYADNSSTTVLATGNSFVTPVLSATTTYYVQAVASASCQSVRIPVTVTYTAPPALTLSSATKAFCYGTTSTAVTLTSSAASYNTYVWDPATNVSGNQTTGWVFNDSVSRTHTLYASNTTGTGCSKSTTIAITVNPRPNIDSVQQSATTVCDGTAVTLNAFSVGLTSGDQFLVNGYGTSAATSAADEEILMVTLGTMTNTSTCTSMGNAAAGSTLNLYSDYTTTVAPPTVYAGDSSLFRVTLGYCGTFAYSNMMGLYIDWNRDGDFLDANEYVISKAYGAVALTGTTYANQVRVPADAAPGYTRMRVVYTESSTISPTGTYSFGETEDYAINVIGRTLVNPANTYTWNPGGITGSTVSVTPHSNTTYTVSAVNNVTGCVSEINGTATINVNALPDAPLTANSYNQCGYGVPQCTAGGTADGNFRWYLQSTGGTALAGQVNSSLSNYYIDTTTTFYVSIFNGTCESPRVAVTAFVNQPDDINATVDYNSICLHGTVNLSVSQVGTTQSYTYTWSATPTLGSGMASPVSGSTATVTPDSTGNFVFTVTGVDGTCTTVDTVNVRVNVLPLVASVTANSATICNGFSTQLSVTSPGIGTGPQTMPTGYAASAATSTNDDEIFNFTLNGTTLNNSSTCATVAPGAGSSNKLYSNYTTSVAAPLLRAGNTYSGSITIGQCLTTAYTTGYAIFVDLNRNGTFETNERMFSAANTTSAVAGTVKTFSFVLPSGAAPGKTLMRVVAVEATTGTSINPTGTYTWGETEDYAVNIESYSTVNSSYTYTWNPGSLTGSTVSASPNANQTYTVTVYDPASGCSSQGNVAVTVNPVPTAPNVDNNQEQCGLGYPSATVSSSSNSASPRFRWYSAATTGTLLQDSTLTTFATQIRETDTLWVSEGK